MFVSPPAALIGIVIALVFGATRSFTQGTSTAYAVFAADGRKTLPFRTSNGVDMVTLDQVAPLFGLTVSEDAVTGGLTIRGRGQPIVLLPGQSVASIGPGRIVSLSAQVQNDSLRCSRSRVCSRNRIPALIQLGAAVENSFFKLKAAPRYSSSARMIAMFTLTACSL